MVSLRVGEYIEAKGISYYAFENNLGASRGSISKAVKDGKSIGSNVLEKIIALYPDLNPQWLLTGQGNMLLEGNNTPAVRTFRLKTDTIIESQQIPLFDVQAMAGLVPLFVNNTAMQPIDHISIPHLPRCDGAVYVTGDSMYPLLNSGDIVMYKIIDDIANGIFWGEMYLLGIDMDGEEYITVKYIRQSEKEGHIKLVSENKHHQDKDIALNKVRALALIKATVRINAMM